MNTKRNNNHTRVIVFFKPKEQKKLRMKKGAPHSPLLIFGTKFSPFSHVRTCMLAGSRFRAWQSHGGTTRRTCKVGVSLYFPFFEGPRGA